MTGNANLINNVEDQEVGSVTLVNGEELKIKGVGTASIQYNGTETIFSRVLYVPDLSVSLISISSLCS